MTQDQRPDHPASAPPDDAIPGDDAQGSLRGLIDAAVRRTRLGMIAEGLLRAFWPLLSLLAVLWSLLAFGLAEWLTRGQIVATLAAFAVAAVYLAVAGLRGLVWPSQASARDRVDADLPGRPLAALTDTQALGAEDSGARVVWEAHRARMRDRARDARAIRPDFRLASRDPWALRLCALVGLGAALAFAGGEGVAGLQTALKPGGAAEVATGPSFEGWAEPPAYTNRPTLYLPEIRPGAPLSVPVGTRVTLRTYGDTAGFALTQTVSAPVPVPAAGAAPGTAPAPGALTETAPGIGAAEIIVARDGVLTLSRDGALLGEWTLTAEPDLAPTIALAEPVAAAELGKTRLAYAAGDDHGITAARAEITLDPTRADRRFGLLPDPVGRPPLAIDLPLPMTGGAAEVNETLVEDFAKHPWAGLPVTLTLTAEDAIGQTGGSGPVEIILPARPFYDPMAAALIEQRRDLLWSPENATRVTRVLRAVTAEPNGAPGDLFTSARAYLVTRVAIRQLARATAAGDPAPVVDEVAEALWQAAVQIEDGALGDAKQRLDRAKERLSEALKNDAPDEEIARLMDELREATRDYMEQMAREAIERGEQQQAESQDPGQTITQDQIQELMEQIQKLSDEGRKAEAEQLLSMLQEMLDNMRMAMGKGGEGEGQGGPGQQAMQGMADALREQQGLADESFQEMQRRFREGRPDAPDNGQIPEGQSEGRPGENGAQGQRRAERPGDPSEGGAPGAEDLARRQEALRQLMEDMQGQMPGEAGEGTREAMRQAERDMGDARDRLDEGDTQGALDSQADAIDRLRDGIREMSEDLRQAENGTQQGQGDQEGQSRAENGNDPLGRPLGTRGGIGGSESILPEGDSLARGRALLDEIRRRAGEQTRPPLELDYLRRLLDQF